LFLHKIPCFHPNGGLHPNISLYHETGTKMIKLIISWNTFSFCKKSYHNVAIVKKDYEGLNLMVLYPWNFVDVKR
jgi:hypothetical protein